MPILDENSLEFLSHSPEQTQRLGVRLGELIHAGAVVCLEGDLGAGKTTLAQGIARGWGSLDPVTSPTFVLIQQYRRADQSNLYHVDAFRLQDVEEGRALGLEEIMDGGSPVMIEWPEKVRQLIPEDHLWIGLSWVDESRRRLQIRASGDRYERLLKDYRKAAVGG